MARFYGWKDEYIRCLQSDRFVEYYGAIEIIDAREKLSLLEIFVSTTQSNKSAMSPKNIFKKYNRLAGIEEKVLTGKEAGDAIRRALSGK